MNNVDTDSHARVLLAKQQALRARRRAGLYLGGLLAFVFGGWLGLIAAVLFVSSVRAYNAARGRI